MQILERLQIKSKKKDDLKFQAIILKSQTSKNSYGGEILGRALVDWVVFACGDLDRTIVNWDGKENVLTIAKNYIRQDSDYTLILLSTTPLLKRETIREIIEYATFKDCVLCKLPVGYIVKNSYILNTEQYSVDSLYSQNIEDFFVVENKKQFVQAEDILQDRINSFHMSNGVEISKPRSVYIEPEVDISSGVTILSNNTLKGNTVIGSGVILKENNVINSSQIHSGSCISGSVIENSIISSNVYISAFCEIKDSLIGNDSIIESGSKIYKYRLESNSKVKNNTVLGENNVSDSGTR